MLHNLYLRIISQKNLFIAYDEFCRGKRKRKEVAEFELNLEENIFSLHQELKNYFYQHNSYCSFRVCDPKPRIIHKANVRDRVVHQAVYRILSPIFEKIFIYHSYSSRLGKGTHQAVKDLECFVRKISKNFKNPCFGLKIDIKKFFHSIDHNILISLLRKKIKCQETIWLCEKIIFSFEVEKGKGLPLGNTTSQLFANVYLNSLDYFIKHKLKKKCYLRFCDDMIFVEDRNDFYFLPKIEKFIKTNLLLAVKKDKIIKGKLSAGFDFLGYIILSYHTILRPETQKRMLKRIRIKKIQLENGLICRDEFEQTIASYQGLLKHCPSYQLRKKIKKLVNE